jgi:hypothetical protein
MLALDINTACADVRYAFSWEIWTYHAGINGQPSLVFEILDDALEQLIVDGIAHLLVHPALVAGHVVRLDGHAQCVRRIHPVDIDIHFPSVLVRVSI